MRVTVDCSNGKRGPDIPFLPLLRARNSTARLCVRKVPCRPHQGSPTWPLCSPVRPPSTGPPGSLLVISHVLTGPHSSTCVLEGMQPTTPLPAVRFQSSFPSPGKPLLTPGETTPNPGVSPALYALVQPWLSLHSLAWGCHDALCLRVLSRGSPRPGSKHQESQEPARSVLSGT